MKEPLTTEQMVTKFCLMSVGAIFRLQHAQEWLQKVTSRSYVSYHEGPSSQRRALPADTIVVQRFS